MAENSKIQWTHHTFNPWRGCTKISPGCTHCYADTLSKRNPAVLGVWGDKGTRVIASEAQWKEPLKWDRAAKAAGERHRVFCASLADVFDAWDGVVSDSRKLYGHAFLSDGSWGFGPSTVGSGYTKTSNTRPLTLIDVRTRLWELINATPNLDWLLLTKRPENFRDMLPDRWFDIQPPPNVWLGVSVEDQRRADERIPLLLQTPAAVRFLSVEPLLGPVDLGPWLGPWTCDLHNGKNGPTSYCGSICRDYSPHGKSRGPLDWIIVGGESGPNSRPFDLAWARSIHDQCKTAGVPFFFKQAGANAVTNDDGDARHAKSGTRYALGTVLFKDKKGGDPEEWPEDLRVREFPR